MPLPHRYHIVLLRRDPCLSNATGGGFFDDLAKVGKQAAFPLSECGGRISISNREISESYQRTIGYR
jgi:hypothetical protein